MLTGFHCLPLVRQSPATGQGDRDFRDPAIVEVQSQWNEGQPLLLHMLPNPPQLGPVNQQLPPAKGVVILAVSVAVGGDMALQEPEFVALDTGVGLVDGHGPFSDALDLRSAKGDAAFDSLEDFVTMGGLAILAYAII